MELTNNNYYSDKSSFSNSLYHSFVGTSNYPGCEARTMAILKGDWKQEPTTAMLIGSYVDAYFSGEIEQFKNENPAIFTSKGALKAEFEHANKIIEVAKSDPYFYSTISGKTQVIVTGTIGGANWKGKIDSLLIDKAIVDLKVISNIRDLVWNNYEKTKETFIEASGYIDQGAIYRELYFQMTGNKLPFFIAALTKEKFPDKEIIRIPDHLMDEAIKRIEDKMKILIPIKNETLPPTRCERCDYCKSNRQIQNYIWLYDLYQS